MRAPDLLAYRRGWWSASAAAQVRRPHHAVRLLRLVASEAMLVDFERADLRFQRRSRDPESCRRPGRAGYAALARGERRLKTASSRAVGMFTIQEDLMARRQWVCVF